MTTVPQGFAVVDKEAGWTSHDVVARARGVLGTRKVGHAGTLDPDATGVLLLGIGAGTRLLRFLAPLTKHYEAEVVFGVETSTLDASGAVVAVHDMSTLAPETVTGMAASFLGPIEQIPPMVSAVKVGGRRLHELARQGIEVERAPRPVTVHRLELEPTSDPLVYSIHVSCSSGTYVRTLAADIGHACGGGAHLRALRRTRVGSFGLDEAVGVERVRARPLAEALRDLPAVSVTADVAGGVVHGKVLEGAALGVSGDGPWPVLGPDGGLLAVYEAHRGTTVKPAMVVPSS